MVDYSYLGDTTTQHKRLFNYDLLFSRQIYMMSDDFNLSKGTLLTDNLRRETKGKFDSLLKAALFKRGESKNAQQEFVRSTERLIENDVGDVESIDNNDGDGHSPKRRSDNIEDARSVINKPPVPKPRKHKTGKINNENKCDSEEKTSVSCSGSTEGTYTIRTSPKIKDCTSIQYDKSGRDTEMIGNVIIDDNPSSLPGIIKKKSKRTRNESELDKTDNTSDTYSTNNTGKAERETDNNKNDSEKEEAEKEVNEIKPKPKERKTKRKRSTNDGGDYDREETSKNNYDRNDITFTYENIVEITIHKSEKLQMNSFVVHPVVKVHIMNSETGEYLKKSDLQRRVLHCYENSDFGYIGTIMTRPYHLKQTRTLCPQWEESIIVNEDYSYLTHTSNHVIVFFEIVDFMSAAAINSELSCSGKGWHRIAWAFLKIVGQDGTLNTNKRVRLQLYSPIKPKTKRRANDDCNIYQCWKSKKWIKYPSTLYVTIKSVVAAQRTIESVRSRTPPEKDTGTATMLCEQLPELSHENTKLSEDDRKQKSTLNRSKFKVCKLPNRCVAKLYAYDEGSMVLKFSNDGLHLASAVLIDDVYAIVVYSVERCDEVFKFICHQKMIYGISWSEDDQLIISSSADGTVSIWNFAKRSFVQMLPHPSYLYAAEISTANVIATGCYDSLVRIWTCDRKKNGKVEYVLSQELQRHEGYVTSLCFNKNSSLLYSADSCGVIVEWTVSTGDDDNGCCERKRDILLTDLKGVIVNQILLHSREKKLIVHARDSTIRIVDLKTEFVIHWLQGAINNRIQTYCTLSPCGTFVLSGGENCVVNVWNLDTGKFVAAYFPWGLDNDFTIHCVQFHPYDNTIAFGQHGKKKSILLCTYDPNNLKDSDSSIELRYNGDHCKLLLNDTPVRVKTTNTNFQREKSGLDHDRTMKVRFKNILRRIDTIIVPQAKNDGSMNKTDQF